MKKVLVLHDRDADGLCAASIVSKFMLTYEVAFQALSSWEENQPYFDANFRAMLEDVSPDIVYMVDCSLSDTWMNALNAEFEFYWIDHHDHLEDLWGRYKGAQGSYWSACEWAWIHYTGAMTADQMPTFVNYIGQYDTFRDQDSAFFEQVIIPHQVALEKMLSLEVFEELLDRPDFYLDMVSVGQKMWQKEIELYEELPKTEIKIGEYTGLLSPWINERGRAAFLSRKDSRYKYYDFHLFARKDPDEKFIYSFRTIKMKDVRVLPTGFDIRGHAGAAGGSSYEIKLYNER